MPSKMRHELFASLAVIGLIVISFNASYGETTNYIYDELNRLRRVVYEDGTVIEYTYDGAGNRLAIQPPDTTPPTGTITINSGDPVTNDPVVTLTLTCSDNIVCSQMRFSNDDVTYSTAEAYGTTKSWTLSPGEGTKTVYAKFKDAAENWSTACSDTIDFTDSYTKSLLHMNGVDGSTTFADTASGGTHTWTASGNAQIDTAQSKFGGASGLFDGNGDYIWSADSSDWAFGTGDFTIDFWMKLNNLTTYQTLYSQRADANNIVEIYYYGALNDSIRMIAKSGGSIIMYYYTTGGISDTNWHHLALVRNGTNFWIFFDGVSQTLTIQTAIGSKTMPDVAAQVRIGGYNGGTYWYNGWLDDYRISKGIARWTANFTPPTQEY